MLQPVPDLTKPPLAIPPSCFPFEFLSGIVYKKEEARKNKRGEKRSRKKSRVRCGRERECSGRMHLARPTLFLAPSHGLHARARLRLRPGST